MRYVAGKMFCWCWCGVLNLRDIMCVIIISPQIYNNHSSSLFLLVLFFNRPLLFILGTVNPPAISTSHGTKQLCQDISTPANGGMKWWRILGPHCIGKSMIFHYYTRSPYFDVEKGRKPRKCCIRNNRSDIAMSSFELCFYSPHGIIVVFY